MNILFIGDYRSAANYGSIATTECLIDLINSKVSANDDMKIIDRRSYDHSTPKAGFNQTLKYRIRKKIPLRVWQKCSMLEIFLGALPHYHTALRVT